MFVTGCEVSSAIFISMFLYICQVFWQKISPILGEDRALEGGQLLITIKVVV
jgi:hypothetical protein